MSDNRAWAKRFKFCLLPKSPIWLFLSIILATYHVPSWSQIKVNENRDTRISITPQVIGDEVTLRVQVRKNNKLLTNLKQKDFSVRVDCKENNISSCETVPFKFITPKESKPLPTRIVLLLDLSGSMIKLDEGNEQPKLQGAIDAIKEFTQVLAERGNNTQMVIVPFSSDYKDENGRSICSGEPVTKQTLDRFAPASDPQHQTDLRQLKDALSKDREAPSKNQPKKRICGETNLYQSLATTLDFLGNLNLENQSQSVGFSQSPRLHVVLLSDGFDTVGFDPGQKDICHPSHFEKLKTEYLRRYAGKIRVHTVGYGLTPEELGQRYSVLKGKPAKCEDREKFSGEERKNFENELVDREHLKEIADLTDGTPEFSGNAREIAQRFQNILDIILDEYQIIYTQKNADTASRHNAFVNVRSIGDREVSYSIPFVFQVPSHIRFWTIPLFVIVPLGLSILFLYLLAIDIKKYN
ncbi:vWA domain-containing protein [Scytonema sp. NUACC26]|uniref:vWA domain-containing protein n=1 Tax=Scytonema sp. NUACC26 TaxID=3140176 RepID=UPI0034DC4D38